MTLQRFEQSMGAPVLLGILFFFIVCLGSVDFIRKTTMAVAIFALLMIALRFKLLRERLRWPFIALTLYVLMDGVSTFYAVSGKFALREFLKVFLAYLLSVILLAASPQKEETKGKRIATILAVCAAIGSIVSIDLLSTRWISGAVLWLVGLFSEGYRDLAGVEPGVRMTSVFTNPNTFAGFSGIGTLLSLGLAANEEARKERWLALSLLFLNSLAFILAFSMGASAFIALAFLVFLCMEAAERRAGLLLLMLETLILVALCAALISKTAFQPWSGVQPVPLLCAVLGAAALCLLDRFVGQKLAAKAGAHGKLVPILIVALLVLAALFLAAAWNLTGEIDLAPGEGLRRAAYPAPGDYTLELQTDDAVDVVIESQNRKDTMMHTETVLYSGAAGEASFTVPEDSLVVYFNFSAPEGAHIRAAACGSEKIPLRYKLLPGFIANRLQGLLANENAIQRTVFFEDGMKLFRRSPVIGLGMGAFENAIKSTQSFYYETKYAHNHYIQTILETGVIGLILFAALLITSAAAIWKSRRQHPYAAMLGAVLVFMAGHAVTEIVFSAYAYLPMAFGAFALTDLTCGETLERPKLGRALKTAVISITSVCVIVYCFFLAGNMIAKRKIDDSPTLDTLVECTRLDRFEWADYALPYVTNTMGEDVDYDVRHQADAFAKRLSAVDSNTIPFYLAEYYFRTGRTELGAAMIEKYVDYVASDQSAWQRAISLLRTYEDDSVVYRSGVARIARKLDDWNANNLGDIQLDERTREFLDAYR